MIVEVEGCKIEASDESVYWTDLKSGDLYVAWSPARSCWSLLACWEVTYGANRCTCESLYCEHHPEKGHPSWILPRERAYSFDSWVSYKVTAIDSEKVS